MGQVKYALTTQERNGNVKVTLKGGDKEKARKLVEDINSKTSAVAAIEVREKGVFVYNIEEEVLENEVKRELDLLLAENDEQLKMSVVFRVNNYGIFRRNWQTNYVKYDI